MEELPAQSSHVVDAVDKLKASGLSGIELTAQSTHLQQAVESLKAAGLSKIGKVVQTTTPSILDSTTNPEFMDEASFAEELGGSVSVDLSDSSYNLPSSPEPGSGKAKRRYSNHSNSISIHIYPESVSGMSGLGCSTNTGTISRRNSELSGVAYVTNTGTMPRRNSDVETDESVVTTASKSKSVVTTATILSLIQPKPASDCQFTIEEATKQCAKGKDLWAEGQCEAALLQFRKALLGLESILGTNHLLVSKLYQWIGQIFLQLLDDDDRRNERQENNMAIRRLWADAAVEALTWCLKIRYISRAESTSDTNGTTERLGDESSVDKETESILARAWKIQREEWSSSHKQEAKKLELIWDSIRIERKADLALFRMEKNKLSEAIDVYASLVNQYNKSISVCSDDGAFSAMTKMAFWYHRLGRMKVTKDDNVDEITVPSLRSNSTLPLDTTQHSTRDIIKKNKVTKSRSYLEQAAFWYRMALETFCTSVGRFDKTNDRYLKDDNIDITTHPTYQQLLLRLEQVLSDHNKSEENKDDEEISYLQSSGVLESAFRHFGAKQAMRQYKRLGANRSESLSRLKALRDSLVKAQEGFRAAADIEELAWGVDHQIVFRMRLDLGRATGLCKSVDNEILEFPARQAERQKKKELEQLEKELERKKEVPLEKQREQEKEKQEQQEKREKEEKEKQEQLEKQEREEKEKLEQLEIQKQQEKENQEQLEKQKEREKQQQLENQQKEGNEKQQQQQEQKNQEENQKQKQQRRQRQKSPSGSKGRSNRPPSNGIETLRRLQEQVHESQKLLKGQNAERNRLRADLRARKDEIRKARAALTRKEEEVMEWMRHCEDARSEREALKKQLEEQPSLSELNYKEDSELLQSIAQKENELLYWKERFKAAQIELTERQISYEEEKARADVGSNEIELLVERLKDENERLQKEVASGLTERKKLEDQQVHDAMTKLVKRDSEVNAWKQKFEVAQKEWLAIHGKAEERTQMAIVDATRVTAELARWKKKFAIAQREWMECQSKAENQARGAIATAKKYEVSYSKVAEKFSAAQDGLRSLLSQNKKLRKEVVDRQGKQDQLEFSLKKQAIDFATYQETLNQKTAEAQIWKDQCQASQQAQKQFSHEMQLSRATDSNLQDRIVVLLQRNKELQADQDRKNLELEAKNKEIASVKEAALKRIRQLKKEQQQQQYKNRNKERTKSREMINSISTKPESKDVENGAVLIEYESNVDLRDPSSLAAKLGRAQRALEYVEKDHKESLKEIESLTKAKVQMKENIADAQHIISLLKTANNERIEQCSKLQTEKDEIQRQLERYLDGSRHIKAETKSDLDLKDGLEKSIAEKDALVTELNDLKSRIAETGELKNEENTQRLKSRISKLESDLLESENRNKELLSDANKYKMQTLESSMNEDGEKNSFRLDKEPSKTQERIRNLLDRCLELEEERDVSNQQIKDLEQQVRDITRDIPVGEQKDNDQIREDTSSSESIEDKKESRDLLEDIEMKLKESTEIRENLELELKMCYEKLASADQKEKKYQRELDATDQKIKSLEDQIHDNTRESEETSTDEESHRFGLAQELERELEKSVEVRENLSLELKSCKAKILILEQNELESKRASNRCGQLEDELKESNKMREEMLLEIDFLKKGFDDDFKYLQNKLSKVENDLEQESNEKNILQRKIDILTPTAETEDKQQQNFVDKISALETELANSVNEIKSLRAERNELDKLSKEIAVVEGEKQELVKKYDSLEKQYQETKQQAEQNSKSLSKMLEVESKEQDRIRNAYDELEKNLQKVSEENLKLESRVEELKKERIENLSEHSNISCTQCHVLGDELRSTIEQNEKHIEATEKFQDDHEKLINRNTFLEKELQDAIEQNESLESKLLAKENSTPVDNLENDNKYQDLNIRCIVLEEELQDANQLNDKKSFQIEVLKRKVLDLEEYADDTASDLERALAVKTAGSEEGSEVRMLIERCSKLQYKLKEALKENERLTIDDDNAKEEGAERKEETNQASAGNENENDQDAEAALENKKAIEELNKTLNEVIAARDQLGMLLVQAKDESEHQKRLKGHVEKDRDYLDKMYNECKNDLTEVKSDLEATKELLKKSNEEKEELERQLQIEKHVSHSLKSTKTHTEEDNSEENELEELYRQARDELTEVENMLFETEEELEALKAKYKELEETSKLSASERAESDLSGEIVHDLQDLSREDLMVETRKALRKLQDTQTKVVDLQETNMILQAQLKSSLTLKEKNKPQPRRNNGNRGFFGLGGGNGGRNQNDGANNKDDNKGKDVSGKNEANVGGSQENPNNGNKRLWGWGNRRNAENETNGGGNADNQ